MVDDGVDWQYGWGCGLIALFFVTASIWGFAAAGNLMVAIYVGVPAASLVFCALILVKRRLSR